MIGKTGTAYTHSIKFEEWEDDNMTRAARYAHEADELMQKDGGHSRNEAATTYAQLSIAHSLVEIMNSLDSISRNGISVNEI